MTRLRIAIDARLTSGDVGGVEQVVIGLAHGLSELTDGDEEYLFLAYSDADLWLRPYMMNGPARIVHVGRSGALALKRRIRATLPRLTRIWDHGRYKFGSQSVSAPRMDGVLEKLAAEVVHFPIQSAFLTDVPSIYHPHDLQHIHLPQFFSPAAHAAREIQYRTYCTQARIVAVSSSWVQQDVIRHYGLSAEKVKVIPLAPPLQAYIRPSEADLIALRRRYALPETFVLYAAQTWPHKNHLGLIDALAILREKHGLQVTLVSCGRQNEYFLRIKERIREFRLNDQVIFLGYIESNELYGLYQLSRAVVIPTFFEAASFPMWEAFHAGVPVSCSNVTSLPEQAGDAALLFDPHNPDEMAEAIRRLWTDESLRAQLVDRGHARLSRLSWNRTARIFRAHYRNIAGRLLNEEDQELLR